MRNAVYQAGGDPVISARPEDLLSAERLILPGVGAAGEAMARLGESGLLEALSEAVLKKARPMLGICLGMQLLAEELMEFGPHRGLGWIKGRVAPLSDLAPDGLRTPHMGWNDVTASGEGGDFFPFRSKLVAYYFAHSYTLVTEDESVVAARVDYGAPLVAAVRWQTVFATQFHPEKSQDDGAELISAFLEWTP